MRQQGAIRQRAQGDPKRFRRWGRQKQKLKRKFRSGDQCKKQGKIVWRLEIPVLLFEPLHLGEQGCPINLGISSSVVLGWLAPNGSHLAGCRPWSHPGPGPKGLLQK